MNMTLPMELWELLRFKNGQDSTGRLVDDTRLLSSSEIYLEWQPLPLNIAMMMKLVSSQGAVDTSSGDGLRAMVVMAENESRTRRYLVNLKSGRVFIARGASIVASLSISVTALIKKILT